LLQVGVFTADLFGFAMTGLPLSAATIPLGCTSDGYRLGCPRPAAIEVHLGAGDDHLVTYDITLPMVIDDGPGDDWVEHGYVLAGGAGDDEIQGGSGSDSIDAGPGDVVVVSIGDDLVDGADVIDCGSGRDAVRADLDDRVRNCEVVRRS
jgi:hypothetical protein